MGRALVVWGGWEGHSPAEVAALLGGWLTEDGHQVEISGNLEDLARAAEFDLLVPCITMAELPAVAREPLFRAVAESGVGVAGCHGGMGDSFRADTEWQFLVGGQFVAHPGNDGVRYRLDLVPGHAITDNLSAFEIVSEQYYLHVDPGVTVLATTDFPTSGVPGPHEANPCRMPQMWVKRYGAGRVFYFAPGHSLDVLRQAECRELMRRGMSWAVRG